jgi:hypothetical protein
MSGRGDDQFAHDYQYVAAGQTDAILKGQSGTGKQYDRIVKIIPVPLTNSPGAVTIKDGAAGGARTIWAGGAGGVVPNLETRPEPIDCWPGLTAFTGPWLLTTGANVACWVIGRFK